LGIEKYVQVGETAARAPDGSFLPAVPLFVRVDETAINPANGQTAGESEFITDIAAVFKPHFKQYMDSLRSAGVEIR
jgi:hypothetical protein